MYLLRIYCYPKYVTADWLKSYKQLPRLIPALVERGIAMEVVPWNGSISTLPTDRSVVIRFSSMLGEPHQ